MIQSDALNGNDSVLVSLLTSDLAEAPFYRLTVLPSSANGLRTPSQVMVDKILAMPREKCSDPIGSLEKGALLTLNHMLPVMIGIAD